MKGRLLALCLCFSFIIDCFCSTPIVFSKEKDWCLFKGEYIDFLEDTTNTLTISDVTSPVYKNKFIQGNGEIVNGNNNLAASYWIRLNIINKDENINSVAAELFDFRINYYEFYFFKNDILIITEKGGAAVPFYQKDFIHKNYIHNLPLNTKDSFFIYYKIKSSSPVSFVGMIRSYERLLQYSNTEYFLLALFYGAILSLALYNLFIFLAVGDKTYIYYVLYVLSVGIYSLSQDGLGFQYIWFNFPIVNDYIFHISSYFVVFWVLLYARKFLNTQSAAGWIDNVIMMVLGLRTIILLITLIDNGFSTRWIDLCLLLLIYSICIYFWVTGKNIARFIVTGFTIFFIGYLVTFLVIFNLIITSQYLVYSFNIGVISQMLLFSFALADRIKIITEENNRNQKMLLEQAMEKESFIQSINKELELKVNERTKLLEEKNKELDTFVYRSSHDIKGPIKSIIGLSNLALLEVKDHQVAIEYFEKLLERSIKLDNVNSNLLSLIDFKNIEVKSQSINFKEIISKIIYPIEQNPRYNFIRKEVEVDQTMIFNSDHSIIRLILKDILETAVQFANPQQEESILKVKVKVEKNEASLYIYGTGHGVPQSVIDEIFDPFSSLMYKAENNYLGLYLLKLHVEKINGSFSFTSTIGKDAYFSITLKSLSIEINN